MQLVHTKTETGRHDANNGPVCCFVTGNATSGIGHEFRDGDHHEYGPCPGPLPARRAAGQSCPARRRKTITFIAALRHNKMTAPMVIERAMDGPAFLSECLGPTLKPGDTVVMDHCPIHKV